MKKASQLMHSMILGTRSSVFLAVAEQGSLTEAAKVLGLHQSSVSYHLTEFEKELQIQLIDRHQKPCRLTSEGQVLYNEILYETNRLTGVLSKLKADNALKPIIRFGIVESLARNLGTRLVKEFASEATEISMVTGTSERLFYKLKQHKVDWIITSKVPDSNSYVATLLFKEPSVLVTPKKLNFGNKSVSWDNLRFLGLPFLRYTRLSGGDRITESMLNTLSVRFPNRIEVDDGGVMLSLIRDGVGWSFIRPATLIQHPYLTQEVNVLPMPHPIIDRNLMLVCRKDESFPQGKIVQIVREFFYEELQPQILHFVPWLQEYFSLNENMSLKEK